AGGILCIAFARLRSYRAAAGSFAFAAIAFAALLFTVALDRIDRHQSNHLLWQAIYARSHDPQVASYKVLEPSWVFYGRRNVREITSTPPPMGNLAAQQAATFLAATNDGFLITTRQKAGELSSLLPPNIGVIAETRYLLTRGQRSDV